MIIKEEQLKIDILLKQLNSLENSDSSTITNLSVCNDLINQKFDINLSYLDICCGKGTILLYLYLKFWNELNIINIEEKNKFIIDKIYGIDISKEQINIAKNTLIKIQKIFKIQNILQPQIYNYNIFDFNMDEILNRKFSCIITNPPYNSERGDNNQSVDIYPKFIEKAYELSERYVIMITKSNWMNFPSHEKFRKKMINEFNVDKIVHYQENPFPGTDIQGGVSYFVIDKENTKNTFELNGITYDRNTKLPFLPYELNEKELKIFYKIVSLDKIKLTNFRTQGYYGIKTNDKRLINENKDNYIKCHVSEQKGKIMYFPISEFNEKMKNDFHKYKIFTSAAYGVPNKLGRILMGKNDLNSESLVNWVFDTEQEMNNWYNYMNTKLFRVCVSISKTKKHVNITTFSLIPYIDFSKLEKINDENIYKYLNLTDEEISIIEERCEKLNLLK